MRIPVVFATDENYIFYTCTAITSLAQSAGPDTEYDVFILTSPDFPSGSIVEETGHRYSNINDPSLDLLIPRTTSDYHISFRFLRATVLNLRIRTPVRCKQMFVARNIKK